MLIDPPTAEQVDEHADELAVSVIAIGELHYGIIATTDPLEQTRRRQRISDILDRFDVLPYDVPTAEYYGAMAPDGDVPVRPGRPGPAQPVSA